MARDLFEAIELTHILGDLPVGQDSRMACSVDVGPDTFHRCSGNLLMASRRNRNIDLPAPYLRRIWLDPSRVADPAVYPFCLPFLLEEFELTFDRAITIIVGENGMGKSTLLEGIATLAGFDEAGGASGYKPVDHSDAIEAMGGRLSSALRAGWLPKISNGWFFRAESFFSVARYMDKVQTEIIPGVPRGIPPDFLSHSHGEGFLRFFQERCQRQGIFIFDEPEFGVVAVTADRVPETAAADGPVRHLPGHHSHALACPDGLSERAAAAAVEIRTGASDGTGDRPLQGDARVLRGPGWVRAGRDRGVRR